MKANFQYIFARGGKSGSPSPQKPDAQPQFGCYEFVPEDNGYEATRAIRSLSSGYTKFVRSLR